MPAEENVTSLNRIWWHFYQAIATLPTKQVWHIMSNCVISASWLLAFDFQHKVPLVCEVFAAMKSANEHDYDNSKMIQLCYPNSNELIASSCCKTWKLVVGWYKLKRYHNQEWQNTETKFLSNLKCNVKGVREMYTQNVCSYSIICTCIRVVDANS